MKNIHIFLLAVARKGGFFNRHYLPRFAPNQQIFARISRKKGHIMRTSFTIQPLPGNIATRQLTFDPTSRDDTEVLCYA